MKNKVVNVAASVQAKLKNKADESGRPFQELLQYYGMERFIYRLSKTVYANEFILKGGLMFYSLGIPMRRPTRDIDYLGSSVNAQEDIVSVMHEVLSSPVANDGIVFDVDTLKVVETQIDGERNGIRITFFGYLGKIKIPIQVDVGFFDEIATAFLDIDYPVLLPDMEKPRIKGYPIESIVSEKLHAMVHFAELNSRWKDYYDIWLLSNTFDFESQELKLAIKITFKKRNTRLPAAIPHGLTNDFAVANQENWKLFLRKSKMHSKNLEDFKAIVENIWNFLKYPLQELIVDIPTHNKHWKSGKGWV
jgi:hypothetical protein